MKTCFTHVTHLKFNGGLRYLGIGKSPSASYVGDMGEFDVSQDVKTS